MIGATLSNAGETLSYGALGKETHQRPHLLLLLQMGPGQRQIATSVAEIPRQTRRYPPCRRGTRTTPHCAEVFRFGLAATLWQECQRANLIAHVDRHCAKREQGMSTGEYLALAALNRAIHPQSTSAMFDWFSSTTLRRHFPHASKAALASQRFWDHMGRLDPPLTRAIWKALITDVMAREALDLSSVCYDGTNFYTFIDTFNGRCHLAKRGKNKQGRAKLRQVSYALFCQADTQVPLY